MTVKTLKKQLAAAIAMVLVSVIALSSSTYAWFASNNQVTATGMSVAAQAEGGIEIAYAQQSGSNATYTTSATTGGSTSAAIALSPISTFNASNWYHARANSASASAALETSYETLTLSEVAITGQAMGKTGGVTSGEDRTNYYMVQTFNIRSTSASALATGLKVDSVSASTTSKDISEALRVAVKLGDTVLFYDPVANDTTPYAVYDSYDSDAEAPHQAGTVTCIDKDTPTLLADSATTPVPAKGETNNGGVDVKIYVFYEGEDAELYSDNFDTEGVVVTVNFSASVG